MDEDQRIHEELREQYSNQERKLTIITSEYEESKSALEANERARKCFWCIHFEYLKCRCSVRLGLGLGTHFFVKVPRPGDSEVTFSVRLCCD